MEINYSQNNEQSIIANYFGMFRGTFLDIGANDGVTLSNTYELSRNGWQGTLVEASPLAYRRLLDTYSGNQMHDFIHAAVGSYDGDIELYESGEHLGKGDVSLLSTVVEGEMSRWVTEKFTPVTVPCVTFATMLGMTKHRKFDFISIDIEGMELQVLPQIDLRALGCRLLCVEWNGKYEHKYADIVMPQSYKLIHKNGENLIYAKS